MGETGERGRRVAEATPVPTLHPFYAPIPPPYDKESSSSTSEDLLPYGMINALDAAVMLGIQDIKDVDTIIEAFRWMAWCFRCLHVLRIPPATHTLKRLLRF
jgi:hypothetical protein